MALLTKIINEILNPLVLLLLAVAIAVFVWGLVEFIWNAGDENKVSAGKQHIIWGLVGLFIMLSVGGIIKIIESFLLSL